MRLFAKHLLCARGVALLRKSSESPIYWAPTVCWTQCQSFTGYREKHLCTEHLLYLGPRRPLHGLFQLGPPSQPPWKTK